MRRPFIFLLCIILLSCSTKYRVLREIDPEVDAKNLVNGEITYTYMPNTPIRLKKLYKATRDEMRKKGLKFTEEMPNEGLLLYISDSLHSYSVSRTGIFPLFENTKGSITSGSSKASYKENKTKYVFQDYEDKQYNYLVNIYIYIYKVYPKKKISDRTILWRTLLVLDILDKEDFDKNPHIFIREALKDWYQDFDGEVSVSLD